MDEPFTPEFAFPEGVLAREVDGEMVLLNLRTEQYYGLDRVGADIVIRLTQGPKAAVLADLGGLYEDVSADQLRRDVDRLIEELVEAGLLDRTHAG